MSKLCLVVDDERGLNMFIGNESELDRFYSMEIKEKKECVEIGKRVMKGYNEVRDYVNVEEFINEVISFSEEVNVIEWIIGSDDDIGVILGVRFND